jgi:hypothetical protein
VENEQRNAGRTGAVSSLNRWLARIGVRALTAWRWRKTVNICGRQCLTREVVDEFHCRPVAVELGLEQKSAQRMVRVEWMARSAMEDLNRRQGWWRARPEGSGAPASDAELAPMRGRLSRSVWSEWWCPSKGNSSRFPRRSTVRRVAGKTSDGKLN